MMRVTKVRGEDSEYVDPQLVDMTDANLEGGGFDVFDLIYQVEIEDGGFAYRFVWIETEPEVWLPVWYPKDRKDRPSADVWDMAESIFVTKVVRRANFRRVRMG